MKTVLVLKGDSWNAVCEMFINRGWNAVGLGGMALSGVKPDLICFTGGADVSPYLYGEENISSSCDPIRDEFERSIYDAYEDTPKVGICRGGQFLNVMNGGKMIQHLGYTVSGDIVIKGPLYTGPVRVDHHQGIIRGEENFAKGSYKIIDLGHPQLNNDNSPEYVLYYPKTQSLCFQPHPEWGHEGTEKLFFDLIDQYLEFKNG